MNPSVSAVIPTRGGRPELLRLAIDAILGQEYDGFVEVVVVYDHVEPDYSLSMMDGNRAVRVITNTRIAGLAGARNSGVVAATGELVGNCDDDDEWLPGKLTAQVAALRAHPEAELCCTGVRLMYEGEPTDRVLPGEEVHLRQLLRSRLQELHPSSFLFRRAALLDGIGLVSEELPGGQSEDYEMLLRVARRGPILNVPVVGVSALRHRGSYFNTRWDAKITAWQWLLERYPEFAQDPKGTARITGQIAFAHAATGKRRAALRWAGRTIRHHYKEPRAYLAVAVAGKIVSPRRLMSGLNRFGRGI